MSRSYEVPYRHRLSLAVASGALALAACGTPEPAAHPESSVPEPAVAQTNGFRPEITYHPNGTREVTAMILTANGEAVDRTRSVFEFCDGEDLVGIGEAVYRDGSGSMERTVGHSACADGRLEPSDFALNPVQ